MPDPSVHARDLDRARLARLAETLSLAFEDDPVSAYLHPDAATRRARLRWSYGVILPVMRAHGAVWSDDEHHCVAAWRAPDPPPQSGLSRLWFGLRLLGGLGLEHLRRGQLLEATLGAAHPPEPHWYLGLLGTRPDRQGRGLGSRVLAPTLERCDREGTLAYLESSKDTNLPFYRRHGFEVTRELAIPEGPTLWAMRRDPR